MLLMKGSGHKLAGKQILAVRMLIVGLLACSPCLTFSWFVVTGEIEHYPNGEPMTTNCGGNSFDVRRSQMIWFVRCYTTTDDHSTVQDWYRQRGWFSFGERMVFPSLKMGPYALERGKQFSTTIQEDGKVLIVQQIIYRMGYPVTAP